MTKPARSRFLSFGWAISRLTCARLSSPLMARSEWPRPIMMAISLRQALLAAHGEKRVAQADHDGDHGDGRSDGAPEPAQRLGVELEVFVEGKRHRLVAVLENRDQAPDDQDHHHDRGDLHDAQRFLAGFVHADDVLAPEVNGDHGGEHGREIRRVDLQRGEVSVYAKLVDEAAEVKAGADGAD